MNPLWIRPESKTYYAIMSQKRVRPNPTTPSESAPGRGLKQRRLNPDTLSNMKLFRSRMCSLTHQWLDRENKETNKQTNK